MSDFKKSHGLFNPISTLALLLIIQFPLKYLYLSTSDQGFTLEKFDGAIFVGLISILVYFFITFITYSTFKFNGRNKESVNVISVKNIDKLSYLSFITPIIIFSLFIILNGFHAIKNPITIRAFWETGGMAYISQIYQFTTIILFYVLYKNSYSSKIIILVFIFHFAISAVAGRPGWIINYFIVIIFLRYIFLNSNSIILISTCGFILPIFGVFSLSWRRIASFKDDLSLADVLNVTNDIITNTPGKLLELILRRFDQFENFSNLVFQILHNKLDTNFSFPFQVIVQPIPRALWNGKPQNFSQLMTSYFDPEVVQSGATNNYLGVGEFVYSFGISGIIYCGILTGLVFYMMNIYWRATLIKHESFPILITIFMYAWIGSSSGFINEWALPMLLINMVLIFAFGRVLMSKITIK